MDKPLVQVNKILKLKHVIKLALRVLNLPILPAYLAHLAYTEFILIVHAPVKMVTLITIPNLNVLVNNH